MQNMGIQCYEMVSEHSSDYPTLNIQSKNIIIVHDVS